MSSGKGGVFSTLLRKSGSLASIGGSPDKDTSHSTPYGDITSEVVVEPEEIKQSERNLNDIKQMLSDLIKAQKVYSDKGDKLTKTHVLWSQSFSKDHEKSIQSSTSASQIASQYALQQVTDSGSGSDNNLGFSKAMEQFTISITKSSNFDSEFINSVNEGFIKPIQALILNIDERKVHRKKYDKAFQEYETLIGKVKNAQSQKKIESITKLYNYEREKTKAKSNYEVVKLEYITFLNDVQNRMHTDFVEILVRHYESLTQTSGNSYGEYAGIKTYIDSLRTWCLSEQDFFQKELIERDQKRSNELIQEHDAKFQPFIDMLTQPPFNLWYYLSDARKNELYPPPPPPGATPVQPVQNPLNFLSHLVRLSDTRGTMSEMLVHMIRSDLANQHASSLGNVFINQPIWCELVEECAMHIALPYIKYLFDPSITAIVGYPERYRHSTSAGVEALIAEFQSVMTTFAISQQYLPPPFKRASIEIDAVKREKNIQHPPTGCLLFGRVFAPFVSRPHMKGLFNVVPSDSALDVLTFFGTMFSHAGTNQTFLASQPDYQVLNEALASARPKITEFFANVGDTTEWQSQIDPLDTFYNDIPPLQTYCKQHYANVALSMGQRNERDLAQSFLQALAQLDATDEPSEKKKGKGDPSSPLSISSTSNHHLEE